MKNHTQIHVDKEQSQLLFSLHVGLGSYFSKAGKNSRVQVPTPRFTLGYV